MTSFAMEAPAHRHLVFKHHPLDRGFRNHGSLIRALARQLGVAERVHYVHDLHLPTLLRHALGTVVINSTVGFSSLLHGTPVKTHGKAVYNLPGLVHQGPLASFWHDPEPIDQRLHKNFRRYLIAHTQINGSFYFWRGFRRGRELGSGPVSGATEPASSPPGHAGFGTALSHQRGAVPVERKINLGHNHLPPGGP
jgi:capsule polysaccharide modification protein KpsS